MPTPIVRISNLTKKFKQLTAVDNFNLQINPNTIFGFLGPNGAGKSTTLRMLLSLVKPDSGQIEIFGDNLQNHRSSIMERIGCIVEKPDFYLYLTAKENLKILSGLSNFFPDDKKIDETFELVGLQGRSNDKVKTYSHGMKQRLGLAQALIHDPDLIILDEPTTGLDPQGIIDLRKLILFLKQEKGKTIILSSHILSEVQLIADEMIIMNKGKAMIQGKVIELLSDDDIVVSVETSEPLKCQLLIHGMYPASEVVILNENCLECHLSRNDLPVLNKELAQSGLSVYSVYYKRRLEDYFLKLTAS